MTGANFSAIRVRLRYESVEDFMQGYTRFISKGGMFIPMSPAKLKPVGTTIRFQFLLQDGSTALLGEGVVRQIQGADSGDNSPVGILVKFTRLNRQSKQRVAEIVTRKLQASSAAAQSSPAGQLDETPIPGAMQAEASDAPTTAPSAHEASASDSTFNELAAASSNSDEGQSFDDLFLSPDGADDSTPFDDPDAAAPAETPPPAYDDATPMPAASASGFEDAGLGESSSSLPIDASGSDVFGDSVVDDSRANHANEASEVQQTSKNPAESANPQRLGSTEAGLQIMAFDKVSDDEAAGLADFDFGSDDGDVDEMFDNIFGDGDPFGGGDEATLQEASDPLADSDLIGATINDGGQPLDASDAHEDEHAQAPTEGVSEPEDEPANEQPLAAELLDERDLLGEDISPSPGGTDEAEKLHDVEELLVDDEPNEDDEIFEAAEILDDDEEFESAEILQDDQEGAGAELLDDADVFNDTALVDDADIFEGAELVDDEFEDAELLDDAELLSDSDVMEEPAILEDDESLDAQGDIFPNPDFAPEHNPAASDDLISVLDSLDSDEEEPNLSLSIGSSAQIPAVTDEDEPDDEDSLASLLAMAQQDIDAKRDHEETEKDPDGDIFDELLGGEDQLPPPAKNQPMFDIGSAEPKKKKGFMSKLFGKD